MCTEQRPAVVDRLSSIGDWKGDTIIGLCKQSAMLKLVEQKMFYTVIVKINGKRAEPLAKSLINRMKKEKNRLKPITFDNGQELADHERIARSRITKCTLHILIALGSEVEIKIQMN